MKQFLQRFSLTISSSTLFALAKQSKNLGAYKMARTAYDKLQVCEGCHCHLEDKLLRSLFQALGQCERPHWPIWPRAWNRLNMTQLDVQSFPKAPHGFEVIGWYRDTVRITGPILKLLKWCMIVLSFCLLFLKSLKIPPRFQEAIDLGSVTIRSKPFHDGEVG